MTGITNAQTTVNNTNTSSHLAEPAARQGHARITTHTTPNGSYRDALFSGIPLFTTRLVRERIFDFQTRDQLCSPADATAVLGEYFEGRDREESVVAFLDTASTITGLHVASVGGLAAAIVEPRQVFKAAVLANAAALVVAHHHPSATRSRAARTSPSRSNSSRRGS